MGQLPSGKGNLKKSVSELLIFSFVLFLWYELPPSAPQSMQESLTGPCLIYTFTRRLEQRRAEGHSAADPGVFVEICQRA